MDEPKTDQKGSRALALFGRALRVVVAGGASLAAFGAVAVVLASAVSSGLLDRLLGAGPRVALQTLMGEDAFWVVVALAASVFGAAAGHFGVFGAKRFSHEGRHFEYFSVVVRVVHLIAALSCSVLVVTGATMLAAAAPATRELLEGSELPRLFWRIHGITAIVFASSALFLLVRWALVMLPRKHDLGWVKVAGGYLSSAKRPVPAHMFNLGQKMWFWIGTLGGLVMGTTGLLMHLFVGGPTFLNVVALVHHLGAAAIVSMLGVHLYMVLFAIKGSVRSMVVGTKSEEEVAIMHSLYYAELTAPAAPARAEGAPPSEVTETAGTWRGGSGPGS